MIPKTLLLNNPIFSQLNSTELDKLSELAISRQYPKGQWITHNGDIWPYLFIVEKGKVNAVKESSQGRSLIVVSLGSGEVFWGLAFFIDEASMPVGLEASEESHIHLWSKEHLLPFLIQNGRMSWELTRFLITRMQYASEILEEMVFHPVTGRLARLLLDLYGGNVGGPMARDLTLDEMAARIGTTREMVCRQLSRFAEDGAIQISRTEFMITDPSRLEFMASKGKG